jgi:hypothetical protein
MAEPSAQADALARSAPRACPYIDPRSGDPCGTVSGRQYCEAHRAATAPVAGRSRLRFEIGFSLYGTGRTR